MGKIGIISDTHENIRPIMRAVKILKSQKLDLVVHCGDIISPPVLERFAGLPMQFVYGNNDGERLGLKKKCEELGFKPIDDTVTFENSGKTFFVYHGTSSRMLSEAIDSQRYDIILTGHTHVVRDERLGKTRVINPGALFAAEQFYIAILDVVSGDLQSIEIED